MDVHLARSMLYMAVIHPAATTATGVDVLYLSTAFPRTLLRAVNLAQALRVINLVMVSIAITRAVIFLCVTRHLAVAHAVRVIAALTSHAALSRVN